MSEPLNPPALSDESRQWEDEYLTIGEVAARLKLKAKSVKNKMTSGVFVKGVHWFSPEGLGPRFLWSAVRAKIEGRDAEKKEAGKIPMSRGYFMGVTKNISESS
jgi:hypothetical protein